MHIHNSYTYSGDHPNLLIKTRNAHKERILPQTTINTFKKCQEEELKHSSKDGGTQMVVVFKITEINYLKISLFCDLVRPLWFFYLRY